ncbi:MAG: hypothetical protein CM15mP111_4510 [Hyphomicrobiales bacterium]|nr:MAG: hypothetical protein CM15mP111_4510 [Hyphomicrobiales bacterium]
MKIKLVIFFSCVGRFNNTQRTGAEILKDPKHISFVNDALTYLVDLLDGTLMEKKPKEIIAKRPVKYTEKMDLTWMKNFCCNNNLR